MRRTRIGAFPVHRAIAAIALGALAVTAAAAQPPTCVRASIAEPFVLPDGTRHPAGTLRICLDRDYSPVAGLHTIVAADGTAGAFLSRREKAETEASRAVPMIAFVRDASQSLALLGYTIPRGEQTLVYWIESPRGRRTAPRESLVVRDAGAEETLWLAASAVR